ncbi:MAG: Ldh family oxidoreductase [Alphaproteobacteria bacterium]|nr:Ldh family oxidoreductase [Alphaproteobacteria bacterium]MCB9928439.1 Ldh family oxidoreductase [Alphaproteobacteria bacterium]
MRIATADAADLLTRVMRKLGHAEADLPAIVDHLIDCELRGLGYGGLARAVAITERIARTGLPGEPIAVTHETPVSAKIEGHDHIGYIVGQRATAIAIDKARTYGLAAVGLVNTYYTGMLSYYAEQMAAHDLVSMIASNAGPWVAPHGAAEGRFGTNPICFGFPAEPHPIIWDIGTSTIMHAEVQLARRLGQPLPEGRAIGPDGRPTTDPSAALKGAFTAWGGHKGSGLGLMVQLLGVLAGSDGITDNMGGFGMVIVAMKADLFGDGEATKRRMADYAEAVRGAKPLDPSRPVRMPFDRSFQVREAARAAGGFEVNAEILAKLRAFLG